MRARLAKKIACDPRRYSLPKMAEACRRLRGASDRTKMAVLRRILAWYFVEDSK